LDRRFYVSLALQSVVANPMLENLGGVRNPVRSHGQPDLYVELDGLCQGWELARLREQYSEKYNEVLGAVGGEAAKAFISAIATLEAAAHLEDRDKMKIVAVIADAQKELAGAGIVAFVGFFKKAYRQHDYWVGRMKTRVYLKRADVKRILGVTTWPEEPTWQEPPPNPTNVKLPLSNFEVLRAAVVPLAIMIVIRPALLLSICALTVALGFCLWHLV
jgi:hypothetical protein